MTPCYPVTSRKHASENIKLLLLCTSLSAGTAGYENSYLIFFKYLGSGAELPRALVVQKQHFNRQAVSVWPRADGGACGPDVRNHGVGLSSRLLLKE